MTYGKDDAGTNNGGSHDEDGAAEQKHQGDLPLDTDVDFPEHRQGNGEQIHVCQDVQNDQRKDVEARNGGLTEVAWIGIDLPVLGHGLAAEDNEEFDRHPGQTEHPVGDFDTKCHVRKTESR